MHMLTKRMLGCLAVTGALALSLAPAAYAAGEPGEGSASVADPVSAQVVEAEDEGAAAPQAEGDVARIGDVTYDTLDDAIAAATDGATIELLGDATTEGMNLSKSLTITSAEGLVEKPTITFDNEGIALWGKGLTFKNVDVAMDGIGATPYSEWKWMAICASKDASLSLDNVDMTMDGTGATNNPHAIYFCSNNVLNITNGSSLTIKNYPQDALEWDGGDGGYNVNIVNSTFVSDHNRSGFTGTFVATIENSDVDVINSSGNGSNGSHFEIKNSTVDFSDNGSHGLSAGWLHIDHSTINASNNHGMGITVNNELTVSNESVVTVAGNADNASYGYAAVRLYNDYDFSVDGTSELYIKNNNNTGLYVRQGSLNVEDGAVLEITGNKVSHSLLDGYGGGVYVGYGDNYDPTVKLPADAKIYNNHSLIGGDDIYVSEGVEGPTLTFGAVGSGWVLDGDPDCTDTIDGWYDDSTGARWEAHADSYDGIHVEEYAFDDAATVTGPLALKAAHGLGVVAVDPADITIYMGGDEGYEGTATSGGAIAGSNSLPEPGFYFVLSNDINQAFADAGIADLGEAADLSKYMTIYTNDKYTGEQLHWKLDRYGKNNSEAYGKFIYRIVPDPTAGQEAVPVRLQFTGDDGTSVTSDEFDPSSAGTLSKTYEMKLYTELVNNDQVVFEVNINGEKYYNSMKLQTGTLNVRYVTGSQDSVMSDVLSSEDELAAARAESPDRAFALLPERTVYYVNGSSVDVADGVAPSLLFDDVVSDHNTTSADDYDQQLANRAAGVATANGADFENPYYQAKYLDLVDVNNGNVWLTASEPVTVYWPYPEGTDEGTEFHLVHFSGLDRTMANGDIQGAIEASAAEYVAVENTEYGIRFTTEGFSPFVLIWDAGAEAGPQPEPPMKPTGNKNDGGLAKTGDDTSFAAAACAAAAGVALVGTGVAASRRREG